MNNTFKSMAFYLCGAAFVSSPALAQEAPAAPARPAPAAPTPAAQPSTFENDIVVTARRRDEALKDVPVAVSVFTADKRDLLGIDTAADIAKFTPGMEFNLATVTIRGIGRTGLTLGADPGIANYFDGVYSDNAGSIAGAPISVERIEVLRGPQGTLFGRNSIGGAINVVSKRPTKTFEGEFRQTIGNYNLFKTQLMLSGPITDHLFFRVEGLRTVHDGYIRNLGGDRRGNEDSYNGSVALEWDPTDTVKLWVQYSNGKWPRSKRSILGTFVDPYDTTTRFNGYGPSPLYGYTKANPTTPGNPFVVDENFPGYFALKESPKWTANASWSLGPVSLKYIGGWYRAIPQFNYDLDGSSRDGYIGSSGTFISSDLRIKSDSVLSAWSNEFQIASEGNGRLSWIIGAYQGHDENGGIVQILRPEQAELETAYNLADGTFAPVANPDRQHLWSSSNVIGNSYAVFGQGDYKINRKLTATLGYRYTWDRKRADISTRLFYWDPDGQGPLAGTQALLASFGLLPANPASYSVLLVDSTTSTKDKWSGDTLRAGLRWEPDAETNVYASFATGYKAGGFNTAFPLSVKPERVKSFEVGYKGRPAPGFQLNLAAFYNDYKNIQVSASVDAASVGGPAALGVQSVVLNAKKAVTYGAELEAIWSPSTSFQVNFNYAYLHTEFKNFGVGVLDPNNTAAGFQNLAGSALPRSPQHKFVVAPVYSIDVPGGSLKASGSFVWTARQYAAIFNTPTYVIRAHSDLAARLTYQDGRDRFRIIAFMNNILDTHYPLDAGTHPNYASMRYWKVLADPRTFGAELQIKF